MMIKIQTIYVLRLLRIKFSGRHFMTVFGRLCVFFSSQCHFPGEFHISEVEKSIPFEKKENSRKRYQLIRTG